MDSVTVSYMNLRLRLRLQLQSATGQETRAMYAALYMEAYCRRFPTSVCIDSSDERSVTGVYPAQTRHWLLPGL